MCFLGAAVLNVTRIQDDQSIHHGQLAEGEGGVDEYQEGILMVARFGT